MRAVSLVPQNSHAVREFMPAHEKDSPILPVNYLLLPRPVFLLEKSHGQRSLSGYSPKGHKESNTTEHTSLAVTIKLRKTLTLLIL